MGRTCPTYRMLLECEIEGWRTFRDGLSDEDRSALDWIFDSARKRASACSSVCKLNPFETIVACALVALSSDPKPIQPGRRSEARIPPR